MASVDFCFTYRVTNHAKIIERGGTRNVDGPKKGLWVGGLFDHMIADEPGWVINSDGKSLRPAVGDEAEILSPLNDLLKRLFGVYYFGFSPFGYHVKNFYVVKEKENVRGTNPATWVSKAESVPVTALRLQFPRPFVFTNVELADQLDVNLKVVSKIRVINPYLALYHYTDDLFTQVESILQGFVIDNLGNNDEYTITWFRRVKKGSDSGIMHEHAKEGSPLNVALLEQVGLVFTSLANNDWEPSDPRTKEAIQLAAIRESEGKAGVVAAEQRKLATIKDAEAYAGKLELETRADVARQNALAESRSNYVKRTTKALALKGADPNVVSRGAADILEAEAHTSKDSKITTLVKGDTSKVVIPVGDNK